MASDSDVNFSDSRGSTTLVLNMIVKNEERILPRLFDSVIHLIDTYCICDTGSTDNTIQVITEYMMHAGKQGEVYKEPFQNFGYNRTHALERASHWGTYALLLDADMILHYDPAFSLKSSLTAAGYAIKQIQGALTYYNPRLVKTGIGVRCVGPTHEYYDFPSGHACEEKPDWLSGFWIQDLGDGGCKSDKFERDIRLLRTALETEPNNDRYTFYLAQSYNHSGQKAEAFETYKRRVALGGWNEEVFYAALEAGNCAKVLGNESEAVYWWSEAYQRRPSRAESLYQLTKFYREKGKHHLAQVYCDVGLCIPYPSSDVLFIQKDVYDYLFDFEYCIICFYTKKPVNHYKYLELLGRNIHKNVLLNNYRFYVLRLCDVGSQHIFDDMLELEIGGRKDTFTSSTPSLLSLGNNGYFMNVRYVNYKIRQSDGGYDFRHNDGKITTLQKGVWLSKDLRILKEHMMSNVANVELQYQGVEDVKVIALEDDCDTWMFSGTMEAENGRLAIGVGTYDLEKNRLLPRAFISPFRRVCEKNWCFFHSHDGLRVVYEWFPLTIGVPDLEKGGLTRLQASDHVPAFFKDLRGSSNGFVWGDEIWFLCHFVEHSTPRHYYHILVCLDRRAFHYVRHSIPFTFGGAAIEFSLGLVIDSEQLLLSYSSFDRTSRLLSVPRAFVDRKLFPA